MLKIKLEHSFLVFLYAYLRHIDLSLDRSRWNGWAEYLAYAQDKNYSATISAYLTNKTTSIDAGNSLDILPRHGYTKARLIYLWRAIRGQNNYLTIAEASHICHLLDRHSTCLRAGFTSYTLEIEELRVSIAYFYSGASEVTLSKSELDKIMRVEHFWQNFSLTTVALEEFIPPFLVQV